MCDGNRARPARHFPHNLVDHHLRLGALLHCGDVPCQGFESLPIFLSHGNRNMAALAGVHIVHDAGLPGVSAGGDLAEGAVLQFQFAW